MQGPAQGQVDGAGEEIVSQQGHILRSGFHIPVPDVVHPQCPLCTRPDLQGAAHTEHHLPRHALDAVHAVHVIHPIALRSEHADPAREVHATGLRHIILVAEFHMKVPTEQRLHGEVAAKLPVLVPEAVCEVAAERGVLGDPVVRRQPGAQAEALIAVVVQYPGQQQVHRADRQSAGDQGIERLQLAVEVLLLAEAVHHRISAQVLRAQGIRSQSLPVGIVLAHAQFVHHQLRAAHLFPRHVHVQFDVLQVDAALTVDPQTVQAKAAEVDEGVELHREPSGAAVRRGQPFVLLLKADADAVFLHGFRGHVLHRIAVRIDVEQAFQSFEFCARAWPVADHENTVPPPVKRVFQVVVVLVGAARADGAEVAFIADVDLRRIDAEGGGLRRDRQERRVLQAADAHGQHGLLLGRGWPEAFLRRAFNEEEVLVLKKLQQLGGGAVRFGGVRDRGIP